MSDDENDHRRQPLAPHENATVRDIIDSWLRNRWLRKLVLSIIGWSTAVLTVVGLFREQLGAAVASFFGGPQ